MLFQIVYYDGDFRFYNKFTKVVDFPIPFLSYPIIDTISCPMNVNSFSDCSFNTTTDGLCSSHIDTLYIECERGMISVSLARIF